jgi:hypothetical protein
MHGIGGRTIAEAKRQLSYAEFGTWVKYRHLRGSLNLGMRVERGSALLAAIYANSKSKNGGYKIYDFMAHEDEPAPTLEEAMETWT